MKKAEVRKDKQKAKTIQNVFGKKNNKADRYFHSPLLVLLYLKIENKIRVTGK